MPRKPRVELHARGKTARKYWAVVTDRNGNPRWTTSRYAVKATAYRMASDMASALQIDVVDQTV